MVVDGGVKRVSYSPVAVYDERRSCGGRPAHERLADAICSAGIALLVAEDGIVYTISLDKGLLASDAVGRDADDLGIGNVEWGFFRNRITKLANFSCAAPRPGLGIKEQDDGFALARGKSEYVTV